MNERELMQAMADHGATLAEAREIYQTTLGSLGEELVRAAVAEIPGVGTFSASYTHKPAREGMNPFTLQRMTFAARDRVRILYSPDPLLLAAMDARAAGAAPIDLPSPLHGAFLEALGGRQAEVTLPVGRFLACKRPATRARLHPRTGAVIAPAMPAHRDVMFRPSSKLKAMLISVLRRAPEDEER